MSAENLHLQLATRTQAPPMVMVWADETADGRSPLVFIDRGVKINAVYFRKKFLKDSIEAPGRQTFRSQVMDIPKELNTTAFGAREPRMA